MADIVQINHEVLETIAGKFTHESEDVANMVQAVQNAMNRLKSDWIGRGSDAFFKEMEGEILPALVRLVDALAQAGAVTKEINQMMQQADEEASSPFKDSSQAGGGAGVFGGGGAGAFGGGGGAAGGGGGAGALGGMLGRLGASVFNNPGMLGSQLGNALGNNFFGGNLFGDGSVMPGGGMFGDGSVSPNDYGIPQNWLSGVKDSLQGFMQDNYNDYGIPKDWLAGVKEAFGEQPADSQPGQDSAPADSGGGSSGGGGGGGGEEQKQDSGGSGGGSGGGGSPPESTTPTEPGMPASFGSGGGGGGAAEFSSPFSGRGSSGGGFSGGGGGSGEAAPAAADRLRYQPFGGVIGGGPGGAAPGGGGPGSHFGGGGGGGGQQAGGPGQAGFLPIGLAAASPFLALLGKAIKKKSGND
ncbi:MAG: hypothetical protein FOGNACKC_05730 [Anaerolineae bacterium]|nr:hypothetical protein [Anaerolineae bacterium]